MLGIISIIVLLAGGFFAYKKITAPIPKHMGDRIVDDFVEEARKRAETEAKLNQLYKKK